jgi:hypothetical protein
MESPQWLKQKLHRLHMTTPSTARVLAHRLVAHEVDLAKTAEPSVSAALRVYEKLRQGLGEFLGVVGFYSLATRTLALARTEAPSLSAARVAADGSLEGLSNPEQSMNTDKDRAAESANGEAGTVLIASLLSLLLLLLGEAVTLRLLRSIWPGAALDDRSSENGRNA